MKGSENKQYQQRYYQKHKEHLREKSRMWYQDNRDKKLEYCKEYEKKHREQIKIAKQQYKKNNLEYVRMRDRKHYQVHKEKILANHRQYSQKKEAKEKKKLSHRKWEKEYLKTEKGKLHRIRMNNLRRNKKMIILLPNIFPKDIPIHYHHIDGKFFVVALPKTIHLSCNSNILEKHITKANEWVEFYYSMPISLLTKDNEI